MATSPRRLRRTNCSGTPEDAYSDAESASQDAIEPGDALFYGFRQAATADDPLRNPEDHLIVDVSYFLRKK